MPISCTEHSALLTHCTCRIQYICERLHFFLPNAFQEHVSVAAPNSLPFGGDVFLLLRERSEAVVSEESLPVAPHEALDALAPPARVPVAAALEHEGPEGSRSRQRHVLNLSARARFSSAIAVAKIASATGRRLRFAAARYGALLENYR